MPHKDAARQKVAVWRLAPLKFRMVRVYVTNVTCIQLRG